jgi:hypothetical protein
MIRLIVLFLASAFASSACVPTKPAENGRGSGGKNEGGGDDGDDDGEGKQGGSNAFASHTVMVIDDGFDATHDVFEGKVDASYRLVCEEPADEETSGKSDDELAQDLIESYKESKSTCEIKKGIAFEAGSDLQAVTGKRSSWNAAITSKKDPGSDQAVAEALSGAASGKNYHGTNVAGVIAYDNPDTRLVFLQIELKKPGEATVDDADDCPKQSDIDKWVRLHKRDDVREAYVNSSLDPTTKYLYKIALDHDVTLVNMSFSTPPRTVLEDMYVDSGCERIDMSAQYVLEGELDEEREARRYASGVYDETRHILGITAAGNNSKRIDSRRDSTLCSDDESSAVVGSYDLDGQQSEFSNSGDCVDYYLLGSQVITAAPLGFLNVVDGTSFSAPMLARYLSLNESPSAGAAKLKKKLHSMRDTKKFLPQDFYPEEIAFESSQKINSFALQEQPQRPGPPRRLPPSYRHALGRFGR